MLPSPVRAWCVRLVCVPVCSVLVAAIPASAQVTTSVFLTNGGRVDWYKGSAHKLIAYDAAPQPGTSANTEVYVIAPDYSGQQCVTCNSTVPKGFVGQPAWHPDGDHIVMQVENGNSAHTVLNSLMWGFDNDLWLIKKDGTQAEMIWQSQPGHSALHPHFSPDGSMLIFTEGTSSNSPWRNWMIHIASVNMNQTGLQKLYNVTTITPNGPGFYEAFEFVAGGKILYSYSNTPNIIQDIFVSGMSGTGAVNLTNTPAIWDEMGHLSPANNHIMADISSLFDPASSTSSTLRTELYLAAPGSSPTRITYFNQTSTDKVVVKDLDWDSTGTKIVFLVSGSTMPTPQIWMANFSPTPPPATTP